MLILAKLAPNFTNSLVGEFDFATFQTKGMLMLGKLSVVKLEAENKLAVCNLQDNCIPDR